MSSKFYLAICILAYCFLAATAGFSQQETIYPCPQGVGNLQVVDIRSGEKESWIHFDYIASSQNILNLFIFGPEGLTVEPLNFEILDVTGRKVFSLPAKKFIPTEHALTDALADVAITAGETAAGYAVGALILNAIPGGGQIAYGSAVAFGALQGAVSSAIDQILDSYLQGYLGPAPSMAAISIPRPSQARFSVRIRPGTLSGGGKIIMMAIADKAITWSPKTVTYMGRQPSVPFPSPALRFIQSGLFDVKVGPLGIEYTGGDRLNIMTRIPGKTRIGQVFTFGHQGYDYEMDLNELGGSFKNLFYATREGQELVFYFNSGPFKEFLSAGISQMAGQTIDIPNQDVLESLAEDLMIVLLASSQKIDIDRARSWAKFKRTPLGTTGVFIIRAALDEVQHKDIERAVLAGALGVVDDRMLSEAIRKFFPDLGQKAGASRWIGSNLVMSFFGFVAEAFGDMILGWLTESEGFYFDIFQAAKAGPGRVKFRIEAKDVFLRSKPTFVLLSDSPSHTPSAPAFPAPHVVIAVDRSASMNEPMENSTKLDILKSTLHQSLDTLHLIYKNGVPLKTGLVVFNQNVDVASPLTDDIQSLDAMIDRTTGIGQTNIFAAITKSRELLSSSVDASKFILLMSDGKPTAGNTDPSALIGLAQAIHETDRTVIHTIGFGDRSNMDFDLLCGIARETGGECALAPSAFDLLNSFQIGLLKNVSQQTDEREGRIGQDETIDLGGYDVPPNTGIVNFFISWEGSELELVILDPSGTSVDEKYPGAVFQRTPTTFHALVKNPPTGHWQVQAFGKRIPRGSERYKFLYSRIDQGYARGVYPANILRNLGGFMDIDLGKDVGLLPGTNISVWAIINGDRRKVAEGHVTSVSRDRSTIEITRTWPEFSLLKNSCEILDDLTKREPY
jgi:hypothetical protein